MATLFQPYTIIANTSPTSNTTGFLRDHCGEIVYDGFGNPLIANITITVNNTIQKINLSAHIEAFKNIQEAYQFASKEVTRNDRIIVFGSFFTVADIMKIIS